MSSFCNVINGKIIFPNSNATTAWSNWCVNALNFQNITEFFRNKRVKIGIECRNSYLEHFQNSFVDISFGPILLLNPVNSFRVFGQSAETRWISVAEESESAANMARSSAVCSAEFSNFAKKELGSHHRRKNAKRRDVFVRVVDSRHRSGHEVNRESEIPR
jgi:hypothetical protein